MFASQSSLLIALLALSLAACNKKDGDLIGSEGESGIGNTPRTAVPQSMVGLWFTGTIGFTNFYNPTNGQWTSGRGLGMFYKLNADGSFEYGWQGQITNYGCTTSGMVFKKGTVTVSDSVVTLYDTYGRAKGEYTCTPASNFDRPDPLKVYQLIVKPSVDELGKPIMLIRGSENEYIPYKKLEG